jgi:hypothetical protein
VQLIFCPNWPHQSIPVSNCVHLVDCVAKLAEASRLAAAAGDVGPVVVMDSFGATEAAIFCVLASLVKQMDLEVRISAKKSCQVFKKISRHSKSNFWGKFFVHKSGTIFM